MVEFPNELDYRGVVFRGIKVVVIKTAESRQEDFDLVWDVLNAQHQHVHIAPQPAPKDPKATDDCDTDDGETIGLLACVEGFNCPLAAMVCTNDIMVGKGERAHRLKPQIPWLLEDVWKFKRLKDVQMVSLDYINETELLHNSNDSSGDCYDDGAAQRLYYFESCYAALVIHTEPVANLDELYETSVRYGTMLKKRHPQLLTLHFVIACSEGLSMLGPLDVVKKNPWLMYSEMYKCFYINVAKENWCDHLLVNVNHSELVCIYDPNEDHTLAKMLDPIINNMIGILLRQWLDYLHESIDDCMPDLIVVAHGSSSTLSSSHTSTRRIARLIKAITRADLYMLIGNFYSAAKHYYTASSQAAGYREYLYKGVADFGAALAILAMKLDTCKVATCSELPLLQQSGLDSQGAAFIDESPSGFASSNASDSAIDDDAVAYSDVNVDGADLPSEIGGDLAFKKGRKFTTSQQQVAISLQHAYYAWIRCQVDPRARLGILATFMIDWFWQQGMDRLAHYYIGKSVSLLENNACGKFLEAAVARTIKGRFKRKVHLYKFAAHIHSNKAQVDFGESNAIEDDVVPAQGGGNVARILSWQELVANILDPESNMYKVNRPGVPNWWTMRDAWLKINLRRCDLVHFPKLALEWFANLMNNITCDTSPQCIQSGISQFRGMLEIRGIPLPTLAYVVVPINNQDLLSELRKQSLAFKSWPCAQVLYLGGHLNYEIRPMVLCKLIPYHENAKDDNVSQEEAVACDVTGVQGNVDAGKTTPTSRGTCSRHARQRIYKLKRLYGYRAACRCRLHVNKCTSVPSSPKFRRCSGALVYTRIVGNHSCVLVRIPLWLLDSREQGSNCSSSSSDGAVLTPPELDTSAKAAESPLVKDKSNNGHYIHVYIGRPCEIQVQIANLLPMDVYLEHVQLLLANDTYGNAPSLDCSSIMVPANCANHKTLVHLIAKERGVYKVYGLSFEVFKFKCIQYFLTDAHVDIQEHPWLVIEALEEVPTPSVEIYMANTSFAESRFHSMASATSLHQTMDGSRPTLPSISTSSMNPLLSERYEYWNGIRMPTFEDATLPQRVNSCADADCITCSTLHNIILSEQANWDKLIEGERKLLYIVLKNTRTDGVVFKSLNLSIKSLEQKPLSAAATSGQTQGLVGMDKRYFIKRSRIMSKAQQLNYTQCIKVLQNNAVYSSKSARRADAALGEEEYILGSHVHARGPLTLAPGDELLIPMVYKANCKSRKFQVLVQAVTSDEKEHSGCRVTYASKVFALHVLPAIKVSRTRLDFYSNTDYSHDQVLNYVYTCNLFSSELVRLVVPRDATFMDRRHVFDSTSFSLALYLVNRTDCNFICYCRLANNSHLVASMGSESLWCLCVPKIGYMHAKGMKPMSFLQHLESRLGLEWTCFPNKSGEICISTIADASKSCVDNRVHRQKHHSATSSTGSYRRAIDKFKSGLAALYSKSQVWRCHGIEELANAYCLYPRVPRNLHFKLQHVIESLVTLRVVVTSLSNISRSASYKQLPCGSIECYTARLHEPFKLLILARVNGTCIINDYKVAVIPYIYGTFAKPSGLLYKGSLEMQARVPLGPSLVVSPLLPSLSSSRSSAASTPRIVHRTTSGVNYSCNGLNNADFCHIGEIQFSATKQRVYGINVVVATPNVCYWHHKQLVIAAER